MSDIQRYDLVGLDCENAKMQTKPYGDYIKYDDHIVEVEKLQAHINELEKRLQKIADNFWCSQFID